MSYNYCLISREMLHLQYFHNKSLVVSCYKQWEKNNLSCRLKLKPIITYEFYYKNIMKILFMYY